MFPSYSDLTNIVFIIFNIVLYVHHSYTMYAAAQVISRASEITGNISQDPLVLFGIVSRVAWLRERRKLNLLYEKERVLPRQKYVQDVRISFSFRSVRSCSILLSHAVRGVCGTISPISKMANFVSWPASPTFSRASIFDTVFPLYRDRNYVHRCRCWTTADFINTL